MTAEANEQEERLYAWIIEGVPSQQCSSSNLSFTARFHIEALHSRVGLALPLGQMTADEPEEGEFEFGEEGRFQKSHLRLHCRLWYR